MKLAARRRFLAGTGVGRLHWHASAITFTRLSEAQRAPGHSSSAKEPRRARLPRTWVPALAPASAGEAATWNGVPTCPSKKLRPQTRTKKASLLSTFPVATLLLTPPPPLLAGSHTGGRPYTSATFSLALPVTRLLAVRLASVLQQPAWCSPPRKMAHERLLRQIETS